MRNIKFRFWDARNDEWCDSENWLPSYPRFDVNKTFELALKDDIVVQQYTGLKDKNGVEIYEGDIVRSGFSTAVVEWDDDIDQGFYWGMDDKLRQENACGFRFNFDPETMNPNGDYEVIGNIFEGVDK